VEPLYKAAGPESSPLAKRIREVRTLQRESNPGKFCILVGQWIAVKAIYQA
jgi:hypothetical protein